MLVAMARVASIIDNAMILMAGGAGLPTVGSHVQFERLIRMAILAEGL